MEEMQQQMLQQRAGTGFVVPLEADISQTTGESSSLQQSFLTYKKKKQDAFRKALLEREKNEQSKHDPTVLQELRMKFVEQAKTYFGVPYARRYWKEDEAEYESQLFLDCCGLIRQILRDLRPDFGFEFGPWNQAYQYDTLPITVESKEDLQPGDLVFIAATYFNPKSKRQKHDMVHVEIWLGEGDKTIGARWQRGKVQIHDSYMFDAKSYHSPTYIFKSIDTWLRGECKSHCPEHMWRMASQFDPSLKSIFYSGNADENASDASEDQMSTYNDEEEADDVAGRWSQGVDGRCSEGVDGTCSEEVDSTCSEGVDGTCSEEVDSTCSEGVDGRCREGVDSRCSEGERHRHTLNSAHLSVSAGKDLADSSSYVGTETTMHPDCTG